MAHLELIVTRSPWRVRCGILVGLALASLITSGCAAVSNPVNQGIPASRIPEEYLAPPKEETKTIPLTLLSQPQPEAHRVDAGDTLGIFIEGILGEIGQPPPVRFPEQNNLEPAAGFPVVVSEDGTLPLPKIAPLNVKDMTIADVRKLVIRTYLNNKLLAPGKTEGTVSARVLVSLLRPRHIRVQVIRQDSGTVTLGSGVAATSGRGTGAAVDLPAYENDVLNALTRTGGLPGLDAVNEIIVQRDPNGKGHERVRIPLRLKPTDPIPFQPSDVILKKGDIVFIDSRPAEVFYTGGLLNAHQYVLPRDYDLRVADAIALGGGPLINTINQSNLEGNVTQSGLGSPSPSCVTVMRRTKGKGQILIHVDLYRALRDPRENILVQAGDMIILQETVGEALTRYVTSILHFSITNPYTSGRNIFGQNTLNFP